MTKPATNDVDLDRPTEISSTPPLVDLSNITNLTDLLMDRLRKAPDHIAFEKLRPGAAIDSSWQQVTTAEFMAEVLDAASGLIATGVRVADRVLIMAPTQFMWAVADFAAAFAGAIVVPAYDNAPQVQIEAILADTLPVAAIAGNAEIASTIAAAAAHIANLSSNTDEAESEAKQPTYQAPAIWVLDDSVSVATAPATDPVADSNGQALIPRPFALLASLGENVDRDQVEQRRLSAQLDDVATIVYTSGTTSAPKGALITHRNLVGQVLNTAAAYQEVVKDTGNTILFLPLTHVLGRALQLICVAQGMRVAHLANPSEVVGALPVLRPTFLVVVPRVLEKIQEAAARTAAQKHITPLWRAAKTTAIRWGKYLELRQRGSNSKPLVGLKIKRALFDRLFYGRLRAVMGGRLGYFLSGAATLHPEVGLFFRGVGVPVIEGYGLTETTAPLTGGRPGDVDSTSAGTPLPGNTVAISGRGEILAKGLGVFAGYQDVRQKANAFVDGYFRTGDIGALDKCGALQIHGRLKNVIVTSTGRTVSPEDWEGIVQQDPLVAHAVLIGDDLPYLTAFIVLDPEYLSAEDQETPDIQMPKAGHAVVCRNKNIRERVESIVGSANASVSRGYQAQYWEPVLVSDDEANKFFTPTLKLKRSALLKELDRDVKALYDH